MSTPSRLALQRDEVDDTEIIYENSSIARKDFQETDRKINARTTQEFINKGEFNRPTSLPTSSGARE